MTHPVVSRPLQQRFLTIPQSPLCYWLRERFFELLRLKPVGDYARLGQGLSTAHNARFVRWHWETSPNSPEWTGWRPFEKGGGYRRWFGNQLWTVDWRDEGSRTKQYIVESYPYLNGNSGFKIQSVDLYFKEGLVYTETVRGSLGVRLLEANRIFDFKCPGIFPVVDTWQLAAGLNSRLTSYLLRATSPTMEIAYKYLEAAPALIASRSPEGAKACVLLARWRAEHDLAEWSYSIHSAFATSIMELAKHSFQELEAVAAVLHTIEALSEREVFDSYGIEGDDLQAVLDETGTPAGWFPLIAGYDRIPELPPELAVPPELLEPLDQHERRVLSPDELAGLKRRLAGLYEAGPGGTVDEEEGPGDAGDEDDEDESDVAVSGARIPIPAETFLEELSQKLEVHPISVYWLLRELREADGVVSPPELRRFVEDHFSVLVLRLLGHLWPRQVEAGEVPPGWADEDGIIPLTGGTHEPTLLARVRDRIAEEFGADRVTAVEREFHEITGRPLEAWLANDFFERHVAQFRKRPIAWHLTSDDGTARARRGRGLPRAAPAFACLVYYHRLDADLLPKLRTQYVGPLRAALHTELVNLDRLGQRTPDQDTRRLELETMLDELDRFEARLAQVETHGFSCARLDEIAADEPLDRWTSRDGRAPAPVTREAFLAQERRYDPDLNDGVRVNIAPLQRAGLLAAEVLASKDAEKAITDRAAWRADERRWCREGKLPQPGWWPEAPALRGLRGLS